MDWLVKIFGRILNIIKYYEISVCTHVYLFQKQTKYSFLKYEGVSFKFENTKYYLSDKMPDDSQVYMDDDIVQAYLAFKRRDYEGCLRVLEENIVSYSSHSYLQNDKENLSVKHNKFIAGFLRDDSREYDKLYAQLDELSKKISSVQTHFECL